MGAIASQITSLTIVFSTVYLDTDQRKHQSSASLAFVRGIHRRPVNSPHKWPVTRKMFPFDGVIMSNVAHPRAKPSLKTMFTWVFDAIWLQWYIWWRRQMEIFSELLALCVGNSPVTGEFPSQRPVTRSFGVFFDLRLNERLSKQSRDWWFETPSHPLWRHYNVYSADFYRFTLEATFCIQPPEKFRHNYR